MPQLEIFADFSPFPHDTVLGPDFTLSGYRFVDLEVAHGTPSFVSGDGGLRFHTDGIKISLPTVRDIVDLRVGIFASKCHIKAFNESEDLVADLFAENAGFSDYRIKGKNITRLELVGGGNEATIAWARIVVELA